MIKLLTIDNKLVIQHKYVLISNFDFKIYQQVESVIKLRLLDIKISILYYIYNIILYL
jgi:hypothetical protein